PAGHDARAINGRADRREASALPLLLSLVSERLHLDPVGLVATAALLADNGEIDFQRLEILDLALGFGHGLGEARDVLAEAFLVLPDFRRGLIIALELHALHAGWKQRRKLLCRLLELGKGRLDRRLIIGFFALDHRGQCARVLAVGFHHGLSVFGASCAMTALTPNSSAPATTKPRNIS